MEGNYKLSKITCCQCGVPFWIDSELDSMLNNSKDTFYCPKGHGQHYTGESCNEKIKRLEERNESLSKSCSEYLDETIKLERRIQGYKGVLARKKKHECDCLKGKDAKKLIKRMKATEKRKINRKEKELAKNIIKEGKHA